MKLWPIRHSKVRKGKMQAVFANKLAPDLYHRMSAPTQTQATALPPTLTDEYLSYHSPNDVIDKIITCIFLE